MRLLSSNADGSFSLTGFIGNDIPSYAILSHTWEADNQEVVYDDLINNLGSVKKGYKKVQFCGERAKRDGLRYFWVDSCCIDKSSSAELQTAINSMFRWYKNAAKCYVYLSDVSTNNTSQFSDDILWESAFSKSRWFTRGWTLQELLAPHSVEFFSQDGTRLGNKDSLEDQIHKITGIAVEALQGHLSQFSNDERRNWAANRQTTIEEDQVYCLLGIFNVYLPLIYGEGKEHAFRRLQDEIDRRSGDILDGKDNRCLTDLRVTDPRHDKMRIEDTKGGFVQDGSNWILNHSDFHRLCNTDEARLLWIKGDPGKGKTMLLIGIIDELERQIKQSHKESSPDDIVLSYFFCQGTSSDLNNATAVLRGLVYLLGDKYPPLLSHLHKKYDNAGSKLFKDVNAFFALSEVLEDMLRDASFSRAYILIDALDECGTDLQRLLKFIVHSTSESPRVKWIVSSRNISEIERGLILSGHQVRLSLELNREAVSAAVDIYINHTVSQLSLQKGYNLKIENAVREHLRKHSDDTFLWVSLVCGNLRKINRWNTLAKLKEFPPGLEPLYDRMINQICSSENVELYKQVLATTTTVYQPVTLAELASITELPEEVSEDLEFLEEIIGECGSFLAIRDGTIYFVHQSAKDYLSGRAAATIFPSGATDVHRTIFSRSQEAMSMTLRRNIYGLHHPGVVISKIETPDPDPLVAIRYSCVHWIGHFCDIYSCSKDEIDVNDSETVGSFFRSFTLRWLEALGLIKQMGDGVLSITRLENLLREQLLYCDLLDFVQDLRRFILQNRWVMENAPLQTYESALVFSPLDSVVRKTFEKDEPEWIESKPMVESSWSLCLQTLEGHGWAARSVAFSHNSKLLASGSDDRSIKIWDAATGAFQQILEGHESSVWGVTFSHNSQLLASASMDGTCKIWDVATGVLQQTLDHGSSVWFASFSHNSKFLASADDDGLIKIWGVATGALQRTLVGHGASIWGISLSRNSKLLASASSDNSVKVWDIATGAVQISLEHKSSVNNVAFLSNKLLASAYDDGTIKVWDIATGIVQQTLEGHKAPINSINFLYDLNLLGSASDDGSIKIWDTAQLTLQQTLEGHGSSVNSVAFSYGNSSLLASAAKDGSIKIWEVSKNALQQKLDVHDLEIRSVAFSDDSKLLASVSFDGLIKIWDTATGALQQTLEDHNLEVRLIAFLRDSMLLALGSSDGSVKIWNLTTGTLQQTLESNRSWINSVTLSHDSKLLASASENNSVKIWDAATGDLQLTLKGHRFLVWSVAFSHDSQLLASASDDGLINIWDLATGILQRTLGVHGSPVWSVAFSHSLRLLASASSNGSIKIWDTELGTLQQTLEDCGSLVHSVAFSYDSKLLALASKDGSIRIWNIATGAFKQPLKGHRSPSRATAFSHNSQLLASASDDGSIKIWDVATWAVRRTLDCHRSSVWSVAFSHNSELLASVSSNGSIKIWDMAAGTLQQSLEGQGWGIWSVGFSHNSKFLASALDDRSVKIWDAETGTLRQTLHISATLRESSFEDTGSYLKAETDYVELADKTKALMKIEALPRAPDSDQAEEAKCHGYGLSHDKSWITWNDYNVLWLPPNYRPSTSAISSFKSPSMASATVMMALGSGSGRVVVMGFSDTDLLGKFREREDDDDDDED